MTRSTSLATTLALATLAASTTVALAAPAATAAPATSTSTSSATSATSATAAHRRPAALPFRLSVAAPARLPDGTSTARLSSTPVGITEAGVVAGNVQTASGSSAPFLGSGWLDRAVNVDGVAREASLTAVSTNGRIAGSAYGRAVRWDGGRAHVLPKGSIPETAQAISATGEVLGGSDHVYVNVLQRWSNRGVTSLTGPYSAIGHVTGMADTGVGIGTYEFAPHGPRGVYPKAVLLTATAAVPFKAASNQALTADAISPNGAWIVGRAGAKGTDPAQVVRLSTSRTPQAIPGALAGFAPKDVNDLGQIVGSYRGHASGWMSGKLYDFNTMTSMPRGWVLTDAIGITRKGDIAATATDPNGRTVAVKLTLTR